MTDVFQKQVPYDTERNRLPGVRGFALSDWLTRDDAFAAQMALRDDLIANRRDKVIAMTDVGRAPTDELLDYVLAWLKEHDSDYQVHLSHVIRPDGRKLEIKRTDPLAVLGQLIQQDLCLLLPQRAQHNLVAAVVCFPANWRLAEKIGKTLTHVHEPVPEYDDKLARRVQRIFDVVEVDKPVWRFNALDYQNAALFQPERIGGDYMEPGSLDHPYFRSERQCILRLPRTRACVFSIHTFVLEKAGV
ncbi:MAG: DUF3445 domain-containing protein [Pseudomonadota bacterium]